jgi:hypothetical protein
VLFRRKVIDINKAVLDTTCQRALRKNPALEKKLLARIRLFNFGVVNVAKTPVKYTFNFLPQ